MADKLLKSIKFPTLPDRYVIGDSTLTEEGAAAEAKAVGDALATKADTRGRYGDLIAGGAEQLMADGYETDKDPYLFRPTGGSADVGNREYVDKIVGGTVGWNQCAKTGYSKSEYSISFVSTDGKLTISGTPTASALEVRLTNGGIAFPSGHKILYGGASAHFGIRLQGMYTATTASRPCRIVNANGSILSDAVISTTGLDTSANYNESFYPLIIDLTALFNPTIADYIYSLEQSQAGAGVAWFRQYFPKDYYPYDPGTLRSVEGVSAHEMVGFNQWDEEWEVGAINSSGNPIAASSIRSKNFIPVIGGTTYFEYASNNASMWMNISQYDANKTFIKQGAIYSKNAITLEKNTAFIKFYMISTYGTTYNHDICINLSDPSRNGEYEPYTKHAYPLDSSLTLRGVPKLVDGKLALDGDVYPPSGEVDRRYGVVDLGTLTWSTGFGGFWTNGVISVPNGSNGYPNLICNKYPTSTSANLVDKSISVVYGGEGYVSNGYIKVADSSYTDAASFKAAMSGVYLVYELATPTTETADGYEHYQICDPSGTEEFVTTGIVPVGHETRYPHDLKKKIETAPDSPSTDGTYLMRRSGGKNTYMALPSTPSANGAYVLTVTVSGGSASYSWTAKE